MDNSSMSSGCSATTNVAIRSFCRGLGICSLAYTNCLILSARGHVDQYLRPNGRPHCHGLLKCLAHNDDPSLMWFVLGDQYL